MNQQLKEILAQVFNLEDPASINDNDSLINDLGADSLDFVEMIHLIDKKLGVVIKADEIILGGSGLRVDDLFADGQLTTDGAVQLRGAFPARESQFQPGMTKAIMFTLLTVADLEAIICAKLAAGGNHA